VSLACKQYHIDHTQLRKFGQHSSWFVTETGLPTELAEELPHDVGDEADQDVRQHTVFLLVPHGPFVPDEPTILMVSVHAP
jgi:hypothetical protein